ncbi:hypothetical protein [Novacetimonas pomaceti]|uniref:hypothetical protein n=1 Tax=Novacetimonas pomaceti TaxID=2021998 RepID=UPI00140269EA|nr:hypothetical protein [Novacetimonas pomaceti]
MFPIAVATRLRAFPDWIRKRISPFDFTHACRFPRNREDKAGHRAFPIMEEAISFLSCHEFHFLPRDNFSEIA